jgi:hypothetical protein
MTLILDDYNQVYVWVDEENHDLELSPRFDYEEDANMWFNRIKKEVSK